MSAAPGETLTVTVPLITEREITVSGRARVHWPGTRWDQRALQASDLMIEDVDTGEDVGRTVLALRVVAAGDAEHGAQGPLIMSVLRLIGEDGQPLAEGQDPVAYDVIKHPVDPLPDGAGVASDLLVKEFWYVVAEMVTRDPVEKPPLDAGDGDEGEPGA